MFKFFKKLFDSGDKDQSNPKSTPSSPSPQKKSTATPSPSSREKNDYPIDRLLASDDDRTRALAFVNEIQNRVGKNTTLSHEAFDEVCQRIGKHYCRLRKDLQTAIANYYIQAHHYPTVEELASITGFSANFCIPILQDFRKQADAHIRRLDLSKVRNIDDLLIHEVREPAGNSLSDCYGSPWYSNDTILVKKSILSDVDFDSWGGIKNTIEINWSKFSDSTGHLDLQLLYKTFSH